MWFSGICNKGGMKSSKNHDTGIERVIGFLDKNLKKRTKS